MYGIEVWSEKLKNSLTQASNSKYPSEFDDEKNKLSFAFQDLSEINEKMLPKNCDQILILDLTENRFTGSNDLRFLIEFQNLKTLILDKNQIQSNFKIPEMPSLTTLWVNHNKIENLAIFIDNLTRSTPNLTYLSMINNKASPSYFNGGSLNEYNDYRLYVISKLENLKMLDHKEIGEEEKTQSKMIYGITNRTRKGVVHRSMPSSRNSVKKLNKKEKSLNRNSNNLEAKPILVNDVDKTNDEAQKEIQNENNVSAEEQFLENMPDLNSRTLSNNSFHENILETLPDLNENKSLKDEDIESLPSLSSSPIVNNYIRLPSIDKETDLPLSTLPEPEEYEFVSFPDIIEQLPNPT